MLQQVAERFRLVVGLLFLLPHGDAGIFLHQSLGKRVHIPDDDIRVAAVFEDLVPVPEKRLKRTVAADDDIRSAEKFAWIFLFREIAFADDDSLHYAFVLAISALDVPAVVV